MRTPFHLLRSTAVVTTPTRTVEADGSPSEVGVDSGSIACTIQPASSREAIQLSRELGVVVFEGYFAPTDDAGTATAIKKESTVEVSGVTYRVLGPGRDAAGKGVLIVAELEVKS